MRDVCLLINGPPRSGKDTAAEFISKVWGDKYNVYIYRFSDPLKTSICSWIGVERGSTGESELEFTKDEPCMALSGSSYRQAQIRLSEDHIKPLYGNNIFGKWAALRILRTLERVKHNTRMLPYRKPSMFVFPDSGFAAEANEVIALRPTIEVALFHTYRPDCDFTNDSRSYIEPQYIPIIDIQNDGSLEDYHAKITRSLVWWLQMVEHDGNSA